MSELDDTASGCARPLMVTTCTVPTVSTRGYCLIALVAFVLVIAYNVSIKVPAGEFSRDWMHTVLHVLSAIAALAASRHWANPLAARALTLGLLAVYGMLGIMGWFIDGVALHTPLRIPLQPADNVFHLLLAGAALTTVVSAQRRGRSVASVETS